MELVWLILTILCIKDVYNFQLEEADTKSNVLAVDYPDTDFLNGWFKQPLDHFNPLDTRKWNQRYTVYDKFGTKSKNVAFLFIGFQMEYAIDPMKTIAWMDYAEHFSATCFYLIHRYYGESHPTEDLSLDNLQYLTSHQAIADAVNFINVMNKQYKLSPDVKWIVFGDEYAGALATWLRMSYSHLVHGAVSSSGILEAKLNFKESYQVLYDILRSYSDACPVALKNAFSQIEFLQGSDKGHKILTKLFHLGIPFEEIVKDTNNIDYFYFVLSSYFHNYLLNRHWKVNLSIFCDKMTNEALGIEIERLVAIIELILQLTKKTNLIINYNDWIENEKDTRWNVAAARPWNYQQCTEFGLFETSEWKPQIFGNHYRLDFFTKKCQSTFDQKFDMYYINRRVDATNLFYGGLNILVSNVVFVYGSLDIWRSVGIKNTVKDASIIVINGAIKREVSDLLAKNDSPDIKTAREKIEKLIGQWLSQN